jgi:plastocyanin
MARYTMKMLPASLIVTLYAVTLPVVAHADVLSGTVTARVRQGGTAAAAVVYAEPLEGSAPARPGSPVSIEQRDKTFTPRVVAVPVGTVVRFPNDDGIFHNVFSLSPGNAFDLGLYRSGASKSRTVTAPGLVRVFCNIHPQMTAVIVAAPAPWVAVAGADGAFRLELPAGRYRLTALSERAAAVTAEVTVAGQTAAPALTLDESGFTAVPHANKFGKPYPPEAYKRP